MQNDLVSKEALQNRAESLFLSQGLELDRDGKKSGFSVTDIDLDVGVFHSSETDADEVANRVDDFDKVFVDEGIDLDHEKVCTLQKRDIDVEMPSFEIIGDIAVVSETSMDRETAVDNIRERHNVKAILEKKTPVSGEFRTAEYDVLYREDGSVSMDTVHREHGLEFLVNPVKMYFSERLGSERQNLVESCDFEDSDVLVIGAGCGPYPLVISELGDADHVVGVEKNEEAFKMFEENVSRNSCEDSVTCLLGDASNPEILSSDRCFDFVVCCTPEFPTRFSETCVSALDDTGRLAVYCFSSNKPDLVNLMSDRGFDLVEEVVAGEIGPSAERLRLEFV